jgi:hypothetical protein
VCWCVCVRRGGGRGTGIRQEVVCLQDVITLGSVEQADLVHMLRVAPGGKVGGGGQGSELCLCRPQWPWLAAESGANHTIQVHM